MHSQGQKIASETSTTDSAQKTEHRMCYHRITGGRTHENLSQRLQNSQVSAGKADSSAGCILSAEL